MKKNKISIDFPKQYLDYGPVEEVSIHYDYRDCVVAFDAMFEDKNQNNSHFFIRGTHGKIDVLYLS